MTHTHLRILRVYPWHHERTSCSSKLWEYRITNQLLVDGVRSHYPLPSLPTGNVTTNNERQLWKEEEKTHNMYIISYNMYIILYCCETQETRTFLSTSLSRHDSWSSYIRMIDTIKERRRSSSKKRVKSSSHSLHMYAGTTVTWLDCSALYRSRVVKRRGLVWGGV